MTKVYKLSMAAPDDGVASDHYLDYQELKKDTKVLIRNKKGRNSNFNKIVKKIVKSLIEENRICKFCIFVDSLLLKSGLG